MGFSGVFNVIEPPALMDGKCGVDHCSLHVERHPAPNSRRIPFCYLLRRHHDKNEAMVKSISGRRYNGINACVNDWKNGSCNFELGATWRNRAFQTQQELANRKEGEEWGLDRKDTSSQSLIRQASLAKGWVSLKTNRQKT